MNVIPYLVGMAVCLLLSAYFSAADKAFSSMNKSRLRTLAEKGERRAQLALSVADRQRAMSATLTLAKAIANTLLAVLAGSVCVFYLPSLGVLAATAAVTVVLMLLAEILPKTLAKRFPERFATASAPVIQFFIWILFPFTFLFSLWKSLLQKLCGESEEEKRSQEELLMLVDEVEQEGSIDSDEGSLLKNVIEFTDLTADEILTHRVDLIGFALDTPKEEIARLFSETKFSRLLVWDGDLDHVVGILHQKDFYTAEGVTDRPIEELISTPLFIPQNEIISDLLKLFQINQSHIAVVVDEYGETLGIVTMEDILEELVGEIWDEHDEVIENFREIGENTYEVNCQVDPKEFCEFFHVEAETECATLNGWIAERLEKIPENDDLFTYDRLTIKVVETEAHRATFVTVVAPPETDDTESTAPTDPSEDD